MATDFNYNNKTIDSGGPIKPSGTDQPGDPRTRVDFYSDIKMIPNPYIGMIVTVKTDETNQNKMTDYKVLSLKANTLGIANSVIDQVQKYSEYLGVSTGGSVDLSGYATKDELNSKANTSDIPTNTSELYNDSGFLTSIPSEYITETEMNEAIANISSSGSVSQDDINTAVNNYFTEHPVSSGATAEQAAQIQANKTAIGDENSGLIKKVNDIKNTELQNLNTSIQTLETLVGVDETGLPSGDTNIIASINRIDSKPSGTVTNEQISTAVNNYLTENPITGTLTPEQAVAVNKVKNSVFINEESISDNVTASDTTKVVGIVQKEVSNFRIPSLTPLSYASNPIITKDIVNDYDGVTGTADPFIIKKDGVYYCFFELSTGNVNTSTLGYAYSYDAITWTYGSKLSGLETRCAFPNVKLDSNGEWYMLPDTSANLDVYKAVNFPSVWQKEYTLLNGRFADTDIIKIGDIYYMFTMEIGSNLNCYYNESGDWKNTSWVLHPQSPVIQAPGMRLAGNIIVNDDGSAVVPCQGTQTGQYGEKTTFYQFTNFSKTSISISNGVTALTGSKGMWDGIAIHQISTLKCNNGNLYVVDGLAPGGTEEYSIGIYTDGVKQEIATSEITVPSINNSDWNDVNLTKVIDSDYMITGSNIKIVSSGVYLVNIQVGADKFRINNKGVPILKGIKNGTKILYLKKNDILTVQIYNSTNSLDNNYTSFIDVIKLS